MNILFLTLSSNVIPKDDDGIYSSVLYELSKNNKLYIVSPTEKRNGKDTHMLQGKNYSVLKVKVGNITKCNKIEKGISTLLIQKQYKTAIKNNFRNIKFDLILYSTPPITFCSVIKYFKNRDNAKTYLMLKDIFPQNAIDMKMFSKNSVIYKYFRRQEVKLYNISDKIGCMSPKNKEYLLENNNYLDTKKVEVFPNSINMKEYNKRNLELNKEYRKKYNIPLTSKVFMYGGNLGKPQGILFVIDCLKEASKLQDIYFVICGTGTEFKKIEEFKNNYKIDNLLLLNGLPKDEYTEFLNIADVGLIFLDYNFTIPNFPSRLLSYMEKGIPILSCTDPNTDIGDIVENNKFGWKCYSNNSAEFRKLIEKISRLDNKELNNFGKNALDYLNVNYRSDKNIEKIYKKLKEEN